MQLTAQSAHACRNLTQASASRFLQNAKTNTKIKTETDKQYTVTSETNQKETRTNSFGLQKMCLEISAGNLLKFCCRASTEYQVAVLD